MDLADYTIVMKFSCDEVQLWWSWIVMIRSSPHTFSPQEYRHSLWTLAMKV